MKTSTGKVGNDKAKSQTSNDIDEHDLDLNLQYLFKSSVLFVSSYNEAHEWRSETDDYVETYPNLPPNDQKIFSTQAISLSIERLFLRAALYITKHQNRLNVDFSRSLFSLNFWVNHPLFQYEGCLSQFLSCTYV